MLPVRKPTRLPGYDYSAQNYYFITVCTYQKNCIFGKPNQLNEIGECVQSCIDMITTVFPNVRVDNSVVMPNHIHLILETGENAPNISIVIGQLKTAVTKLVHQKDASIQIWQRSFHDHIIRNQQAYERIWNYVQYNALKWKEDCYYPKERKD